jgi:hypothetical protein
VVTDWRHDPEEPETWISTDDYEGTRGIVTIRGQGHGGQWVGSPEQLRLLAAELLELAAECEARRAEEAGRD